MNIKTILDKTSLLGEDGKVSITNLAVYIFLFISAFKMLFSGASFDFKYIDWKVEALDVSATLPLLFSLLNYGHRRIENNKFAVEAEKEIK